MAKDRDQRDPAGTNAPAKDPVETRAEEDVAKMRKVLQRTKAEVARSKKLADKLERRTKLEPDPGKKK